MKIVKKQIQDLLPADYNPRKDLQPGDIEYEQLKRSVQEFGYVEPIIYNLQTQTVVGGHQRLKVLKDLGFEEIDCVEVDVDSTKEKALNVALNKISGEWDDIKLRDLLQDLQGLEYDLELTGFTAEDLSDLNFDISVEDKKEVIEDDFTEDVEPICKRGDIWVLGNHRLMCGDSTNIDDVKKLMDGESADLLLTDPPYNVEIVGGSHAISAEERKKQGKLTIKNDKMESTEFKTFLTNAFSNAHYALKSGACFYVWYASREVVNFQTSLEDSLLPVKQELIWNKNSLVMGRQDYQWKHEPCLYGWKEGAGHYWASDRKQTTVIDWDRPIKAELHPTMKPVGLFDYQIKNSSRIGDIVLDLFGGSGTTLIACEQLGRKCRIMELDEHYCDVIINRWEVLTGQKAEKVES